MVPKFRFFDTEERNMYEVESVNGRGYKNKSGKDVFVISIEGELVKECPYELAEWRSFSDGVLMQSTGIKDKNSVEIYEGDIVNVHEFINVGGIEGYEEGEREMIGIVKYGCIFNSTIPEWYLENSNDYIPFNYIDLHDESFEVIGNIYENEDNLK